MWVGGASSERNHCISSGGIAIITLTLTVTQFYSSTSPSVPSAACHLTTQFALAVLVLSVSVWTGERSRGRETRKRHSSTRLSGVREVVFAS
mgnify:CR=1 FL=1